jgi:uncharacterized protein (TIGR02001 family)
MLMLAARVLIALGLTTLGAAAHAQVSATLTAVSDYEFRGVSLTGEDPALQVSVDQVFESGLALGVWGSNLDYGDDYDGALELDFYASFGRDITDTVSWSAGLTAYTYPGSSARAATPTRDARQEIKPYVEGYVDITAGSLHAAQWYTHDYSGLGVGAQYTEINYSHELPRGWSLLAHLGYSWGDYFEDASLGGGELADYSFGISYEAGHFTLAGKVTATDADGDRKVTSGPFTNDARFVLSLETTLPWTSGVD